MTSDLFVSIFDSHVSRNYVLSKGLDRKLRKEPVIVTHSIFSDKITIRLIPKEIFPITHLTILLDVDIEFNKFEYDLTTTKRILDKFLKS